jgi:site-specific recombinase XerC
MQNLKNQVDEETKEFYREIIKKIKDHITQSFVRDFPLGKEINSDWLKQIVKEYYNRPASDKDYTLLFLPFIDKFIEDSKNRINQSSGKKIADRTIQKYTSTRGQIEKYETKVKTKLLIKDIDLDFHRSFTTYLKLDKQYSNTMVEKIISQIKTFVRAAKEYGFSTSTDIDSRKFTFSRDETLDTYHPEGEIEKIFNLDLSNNDRLLDVRDNYIIGLRTGLRISDLKRIHEFHFTTNRILIASTEKTGSIVEIPIHPQIKSILERRNNVLPKIISEQKFNLYVKEVCRLAGITQTILGYKRNKESNRKEKGYFEKCDLVSSHTCRRSFATNLHGKIPDNTIMAITTHKSYAQFMKYLKTTKEEHVEALEKYWEDEENKKPLQNNATV